MVFEHIFMNITLEDNLDNLIELNKFLSNVCIILVKIDFIRLQRACLIN